MKLGLIPARGGSRGIHRKNLVELGGLPLVAHTVLAAKKSQLDRIFVSSDDREILDVASEFGAEALVRPADSSSDTASAIDVMLHAIRTIKSEEDIQNIDALAYLQPTSPFRRAEDINSGLNLLEATKVDVVVSVVEVPHQFVPGSLMEEKDGVLVPFQGGHQPLSRQQKPRLFARNGPSVLIVRPTYLEEHKSLYEGRVSPMHMPPERSLDIDDLFDLKIARALWKEFGPGYDH